MVALAGVPDQANRHLACTLYVKEDAPPVQEVLHVLLAWIAGMKHGGGEVLSCVGRREFAYGLDVPEALWTFDVDCVKDEFEGAGALVSCDFPQHYVVYVCGYDARTIKALGGGQEGARHK